MSQTRTYSSGTEFVGDIGATKGRSVHRRGDCPADLHGEGEHMLSGLQGMSVVLVALQKTPIVIAYHKGLRLAVGVSRIRTSE
jgi:hypothetical protein